MATRNPKPSAFAQAAAEATAARQPLPVPPGGWPPDEFTGLSGWFVRDPFTGKRSKAPPESDAGLDDAS